MRVITTTLCTVGVAAALVLAPSSRAAAQGKATDTAAATARDSTRARTHHMRVASTRHVRVRKDYGGASNGEVSRDTTNAAGAAAGRRAGRPNPAAMGGRADSANYARPRANPGMRDSSGMRDTTMRDSTTRRDTSGATGMTRPATGGTRTDSQPPRRPPGT